VSYIVIFAPVEVWSAVADVVAWVAQPGEWYIVQGIEGGWALAVLDVDAAAPGNDSPVWIYIENDPPEIGGATICG
jgi:hypothetical protein